MSENSKELEQLEVKEILPELPEGSIGATLFLRWLSNAGETLPPHWSPARDEALQEFVKSSDHLSSAVSTLRQMMIAIPVDVTARDQSVKAHRRWAQVYTDILLKETQSRADLITKGWEAGFGPAIQDYHWTDNGGFLLVEGDGIAIAGPEGFGRLEGPLKPGSVPHLVHLDSLRCMRTQIPDWPVRYTDLDGKLYLLHRSRIISLTDMSDSNANYYGVGFCAVSRCTSKAQELKDITIYKQEKLGSRPRRAVLIVSGKGSPNRAVKAIENELAAADAAMDARGFKRYSAIPIIHVGPDGEVSILDFASLPDGFDELTSTQLGMSLLAWAFGVDSRDFNFSIGVAGQTKADAEVQHLKTRGKGPGYIIRVVTSQLEAKFLPPFLKVVFDYQDDEQDNLKAEIREKRAKRRETDLANGVTNTRIEREQMVEEGEITEEQFVTLELDDGRLPDGEPIMTLFFSQDKEIQKHLHIGLDAEMEEIDLAIRNAQAAYVNGPTGGIRSKARFALAALQELKSVRGEQEKPQEMPEEEEETAEEVGLEEETEGELEE